MPGIQATAMAPFQQQAQGLLGAAPGPYDNSAQMFPGEAPIQGLESAGSGLLADPTDIGNQMRFGVGMMGLPGYGGVGSDVVRQGLLQQLGLPMARQRMGLDMMKAGQGTSAMQNMAAAGYTPGTPAYQQAMQQYLMKPSTVVENNMGGVPTGAMRGTDQAGNTTIRYLPGSKQYDDAQAGVQQAEAGLRNIDGLIKLVETHGSEMVDQQVVGQMGTLHGAVLSAIGQAQQLGTLQPGDVERLQDQLPNPASLSAQFTPTSRILASLKQQREILEQSLGNSAQRYSDWGIKRQYTGPPAASGRIIRPPPPPPAGFERVR